MHKPNTVDVQTGEIEEIGSRIQSELCTYPTLVNASKSTNFVYRISSANSEKVENTNHTHLEYGTITSKGVRKRLQSIEQSGMSIDYCKMDDSIFEDNLILIDTAMPQILAKVLLYFYRDCLTTNREIINRLEGNNPLHYSNVNAYGYKFKKFLVAAALGMTPNKTWDGNIQATGDCFLVKNQIGDAPAFYVYDRTQFEEYLLDNTRLEVTSVTEQQYGEVYEDNGHALIKLNLQVVFK